MKTALAALLLLSACNPCPAHTYPLDGGEVCEVDPCWMPNEAEGRGLRPQRLTAALGMPRGRGPVGGGESRMAWRKCTVNRCPMMIREGLRRLTIDPKHQAGGSRGHLLEVP